jgi:SAM-dependent MidA family methyltransferase
VNLRQKIAQEIRERGAIPFSRYMEMCLYDPEYGFYSRNAEQFGKAGDFYTSSDVHAVFGRLLARQFAEIWRLTGSAESIEILEFGPGRGLFARDVLDWSAKKFPAFFHALRYSLIEISTVLREKLAVNLSGYINSGKATLREPAESAAQISLPANVPVIIFANEFFDAFPVEILSQKGKLFISGNENGLTEAWHPAEGPELEFLDRYGVHPEAGERIEVPLAAQTCISAMAGALQTGFLVAIDYGYTREEQLAGRHRGTLATFRKHSVGANPYEAPGEQDITAHVNFTALAAAAERAGMHPYPLVTQSQFLLGIGEANQFADVFEECKLPQERAKTALQLKHLITPAGMGEAFHVLVAGKGILPERAAGLSGLSFARARDSRGL